MLGKLASLGTLLILYPKSQVWLIVFSRLSDPREKIFGGLFADSFA